MNDSVAIGNPQGELAEARAQWFETVDRLEATPIEPASDYQQLLLFKYRQQGLKL